MDGIPIDGRKDFLDGKEPVEDARDVRNARARLTAVHRRANLLEQIY